MLSKTLEQAYIDMWEDVKIKPKKIVKIKRFICILFLIATLFLAGCTKKYEGKVISVHDGDTVTLLCDGSILKVRLNQIDAPELSQKFGYMARDYLSSLILNKYVVINKVTTDKYNRMVGDIYLDGNYINEQLVNAGMCFVYQKYASNTLYNEEQTAIKNKVGIWIDNDNLPPYLYRKSHKF